MVSYCPMRIVPESYCAEIGHNTDLSDKEDK